MILIHLDLIELKQLSIFEQLRIEEALLRTGDQNVCLINQGALPAIVMGISADPAKLIDIERVKELKIPVIRRFSGGGTVVIDENTLFITFIFNKRALPLLPFPEPILRWSEQLYQASWKIADFRLRENDYCIQNLKCGGNAQYIRKERWLHHTSFLWDYSPERMNLLRLPQKTPKYREGRSHDAFLTRLKEKGKTIPELISLLKRTLQESGFHVKQLYLRDLNIEEPHRQSTERVY